MTARFQTNLLLKQYGDYIPLFQNVPRIFMPLFWVEQKFTMDAEHASQIKFALDIPCYGRIIGSLLLFIGIILMSITYVKKLFCAQRYSTKLPSKVDPNGAVIKDYEMNLLMNKT